MTGARVRTVAIPAFTPTAEPPAALAERTVGRDELIARLVERVRTAALTGDRPHVLVSGPRGSGKTHLLCVVAHLALSDEAIASRLALVALPEDTPQIVSYEDLLFAIVERLADGRDDAEMLYSETLAARLDATGLESIVLRLLGPRTLVLVLENLDKLFLDFGRAGQARLRAFVESSKQVMLLASTPLLFDAVSNYDEPWYGAFHPEQLEELSMEDGKALLRHLARGAGDDALADFLDGPSAAGRLQALTDLTGGSPRMWTVLAGCLTVELLDELVPLVRELLDELVPYYQERLGSLPANERKLIVELCRTSEVAAAGRIVRHPRGMRTVHELAEACGLPQTVAATSLNRLLEKRWVRRSKQPGTDQRTTWYEIREPLLRHHLQYRESRGETLRVVVGFLRELYSLPENLRHLAAARPESLAERYVRQAVTSVGSVTSSRPWTSSDLNDLLVGVRCWIEDDEHAVPGQIVSRLAGSVGEAAVLAVRDGETAAHDVACERVSAMPEPSRETTREVIARAIDGARLPPDAHKDDVARRDVVRIAAALRRAYERALAGTVDGSDLAALGLLVGGWCRHVDRPSVVSDTLTTVVEQAGDAWPVLLAARVELAHAWHAAGDSDRARAELASVCTEQAQRLGPDHHDVLQSRYWLAWWTAVAGENGAAADELARLAPDYARVFGPTHPETLALSAAEITAAIGNEDWPRAQSLLARLLPALRQTRLLWSEYFVSMHAASALTTTALGDEIEGARIAVDAWEHFAGQDIRDSHRNLLSHTLVRIALRLPAFAADADAADVMQRIRRAGLDREPDVVLTAWCIASVDVEPSQVDAVVGEIVSAAARADVGAHLRAGVLAAIDSSARLPLAVRTTWLRSWSAALADGLSESWLAELLDAIAAYASGDPVPLLRMPEEIRRIAEALAAGEAAVLVEELTATA